MKIIELRGHNGICGGYEYDYRIEYEGTTVKEILNEIKEFTNNDKRFEQLGKFGNSLCKSCGCWGIYINDKIFLSGWDGEQPNNLASYKQLYDAEDLNRKVRKVYGDGGWYRGIDFHIYTY